MKKPYSNQKLLHENPGVYRTKTLHMCAYNDLVDGSNLHDVLELLVHVSQCELTFGNKSRINNE